MIPRYTNDIRQAVYSAIHATTHAAHIEAAKVAAAAIAKNQPTVSGTQDL